MTYIAATQKPVPTARRCALDLGDLKTIISPEAARIILADRGFENINVDLVQEARRYIGNARYKLGVRFDAAPGTVDCRSYIKFLYALRGIWLPRNFLLWLGFGASREVDELMAGDLVFATGKVNYPVDGADIGHVAMATGTDTLIHATSYKGVVEVTHGSFFATRTFQRARRLIRDADEVLTLLIPENEEAETSDEIVWLIHDHLKART